MTGLLSIEKGLLIFLVVSGGLNGEKFILFDEKGLFGLFGGLVNLFKGVIFLLSIESFRGVFLKSWMFPFPF